MQRVERREILDYVTYEEQRAAQRARMMEIKRVRRVHVAGVLTFLFENRDTIRYQVQEMVRAERMVKEADIQHEIATYNELLGGTGQLGCSLLIEIDDPARRAAKLAAWTALPQHIYVRLDDGTRIRPTFDDRQLGDARLSSVQYLKFDTSGRVPEAVGVDHPDLTGETLLTAEQRAALRDDLGRVPSAP